MSTAAAKELIAGGVPLSYLELGAGAPILLLHGAAGLPPDAPFLGGLAALGRVIAPTHPGFGHAVLPDWIDGVDDLAYIYLDLLEALDLRDVTVIGCSMGGWIAAEMASLAPSAYRALVLVGAMGIKPPEGDIADQAIVSYIDYPRSGFHDQAAFAAIYGDVTTDQLEAWDIAREMSFRTAWKPYMYSQTLPHLLGGVRCPALVVWGDDDRIVPISAGHAYAEALPGATLTTIPACGHFAEMEKPDAVAGLAIDFLTRS